ncbi:hypothetical protein [Agreia sp. VKM Ac-1783]|uniref:hypothetical protein n=1 Tax=Agreia sp. VKM Ac-1783 TaxID=1938889 RepID=UPI0020164938|nr:hypothetical protein [Agreia sp. VKM Ac-1783]
MIVHDYRAYLPALSADDTGVAVADWSLAWCASGLRFLLHTLHHLVGEVPRVELSDRTHDAVQEHAGRSLIYVFGGRNEAHVGSVQGEVYGDIIGTIAGKAVDLMDNAIRDGVVGHVSEHSLQLGSI